MKELKFEENRRVQIKWTKMNSWTSVVSKNIPTEEENKEEEGEYIEDISERDIEFFYELAEVRRKHKEQDYFKWVERYERQIIILYEKAVRFGLNSKETPIEDYCLWLYENTPES